MSQSYILMALLIMYNQAASSGKGLCNSSWSRAWDKQGKRIQRTVAHLIKAQIIEDINTWRFSLGLFLRHKHTYASPSWISSCTLSYYLLLHWPWAALFLQHLSLLSIAPLSLDMITVIEPASLLWLLTTVHRNIRTTWQSHCISKASRQLSLSTAITQCKLFWRWFSRRKLTIMLQLQWHS